MLRAACLSSLAFLSTPLASADVLTPSEVLRVEFTIDNAFNLQPNTLSLNFGIVQVLAAYTERSAALYDGSTLLGIDSKTSFGSHVGPLSLNPSNSWVTATSPYTFKNPTIVDFTTILDGTIQGRVDFTIATGAIDIPLNQVNLRLLRATGPSSGNVVTPPPTVTSVAIVNDIGGNYCGPAAPNSSGGPAAILAFGSTMAGGNPLRLDVTGMPTNQFGYFLGGQTQGFFNPAGSQGFICLTGTIGRFNRPGEIQNSGALGAFGLDVNTNDVPVSPPVAIQPGETWNFQAWFRDNNPGLTSNFSDGIEITFQ
ncbi:MAG: hypothetical protein GY711_23575 [bacterium]|nr:hypothetical protein [bacterium]